MDASQSTHAPGSRANWIQPHGNVGGKLNELAITRVVRITAIEPIDKVDGMLWLDIGVDGSSSTLVPVTTKTGPYTVADSDYIINCDASGGPFTVTILTAVGRRGRLWVVKKIDPSANAVTVIAPQDIDLAASQILASQLDTIELYSDNVEYWLK